MAAAVAPVSVTDTTSGLGQDIAAALSTSFHSFLQPTSSLHTTAILAAKKFLDPLASSVGEGQEARRRESRGKRKRSEYEADGWGKVLRLREVHIEGFGISQIWEQARRIIDAAEEEVERELREAEAPEPVENGHGGRSNGVKRVHFDEDGSKVGSGPDDGDIDVAMEETLDDGLGVSDKERDSEGERQTDSGEDVADEDIEEGGDADGFSESEAEPQVYIPDPDGLNDGFFSIDDFNKQSHFLEQQDAMGEDDRPSDEDEIDWDADPLAVSLPSAVESKKGTEVEEWDGDGEDDGDLTFGNADLNAPSSEDENDDYNPDFEDGMPALDNTNEIKYADFFEAPPQKLSKSKRMRALPKTQPPPTFPTATPDSSNIDGDIQRAISDVRRDLFHSESEHSSSSSEGASDADNTQAIKPSSTTTKNLSTHEKQLAKISSEIRRLEAAAVAKRDWTLSGEALAADRPVNSLIEQDLEFERAGKPVPVITAEVSEELEALIKRRIIAREFDEVVRRRPDALGAVAATRRGRVMVDDSKPSQGLADVYEAEHLKASDPRYVDQRSAALKRQHDEITKIWKDVSAKLDVLSNLHFKPKRTELSVQVVSDKPTISMEDARPGAVDNGAGSRLAPQEIYTPGEKGDGEARKGEVVGKGGAAKSKEEMTREEKVRRRRRDKERAKKKRGNEAVVTQQQQEQQQQRNGGRRNKAQEKSNILDELRKGGVKVIGKGGDVEEIAGRRRGKGAGGAEPRGTAYKL